MVYRNTGGGGGSGPGPGGVLPAGTAQGELLQWDTVLGVWLVTAAPANEDTIEYDSVAGIWVPTYRQTQIYSFGALGTAGGVTSSFLYPWFGSAVAVTTEVNAGSNTVTRDGILRRFFVRHANPGGTLGDITYVLRVNGADALSLVLSSNSAGPASNLVTQIAVSAGDRLSMRADYPVATVGNGQRMVWNCEFKSAA